MHFSHGMQEVVGSIPSSSTIFHTVFGIYLNGLTAGVSMCTKHLVTVLHEVPGHHRVTRFLGDKYRENSPQIDFSYPILRTNLSANCVSHLSISSSLRSLAIRMQS